jgi:hypothetical protein
MVQPVQVGGTKKKLSALCREVPGQAKPWLQVVTNTLRAAASAEIEIHICRQYVWKNDQMVFGWHVGFDCPSAKELTRRVNWLHDALRGVQPELVAPDAVTSVVAQPPPAAQDDEEEADPEATLTPEQRTDLAARRARYASRTTAAPRAPSGPAIDPPTSQDGTLKVVFRGQQKNQKNQLVPVIVEEFPLPYSYGDDMNKPNEKGRGASTLG